MMERFELAAERLSECAKETFPIEVYDRYFKETGSFLQKMSAQYTAISDGKFNVKELSLEELKAHNESIYQNV